MSAEKLERIYVLQGYARGEEQEQFFTDGEKDLALHVAQRWYVKGWKPYLFSKTYKGDFRVEFDFRKVKQAAKFRKAA